jgi:ankyrin repeat protein
MKKLLLVISAFIAFTAHAQQNLLLEQSFWKSAPDVNAVKAAIEKGNSPSQFNAATFDPVVLAINADAPASAIKYLLGQPGNEINKLTHDSRNYMHWAAIRGNVEIMEYLVSKGAKADGVDSHGSTPLNFAAGAGQTNTKVYDICMASGGNLKKDVNEAGANALLLAVANDKNFALTDYFVSKGLDLKCTDAMGNNAFAYAARSGNIEHLKAILKKGVPAQDNAMLMAAQGSRGGANSIEVYQYLESLKLKPGAIGKNGENVLHALVRKQKQNEIIEYFLAKGVDVNKADAEGNTPFMNAAASNRDISLLNLLAPQVKNINQANSKGATALAMAVRSNSPEVITYLVDKGASINSTDGNGDNLAFYLVQSYNARTAQDFDAKMKLLEEKGLKVNAPQKNGNTLYHLAVAKNDLSLVKRVAAYDVDVNAKNQEGLTALHKAALISKNDAILLYLLSVGAKKEIVTNFDETAFDLASENESFSKNKSAIHFLK